MTKLPEILSETPDLQNGNAVTRYQYADGSVGFKEDGSEYLFVTAPDGTKTTYKSERCTKVEKPNREIEFYFDNEDNRLMAVVGVDNTITTYQNNENNDKYEMYEGVDRSEYEKKNYLYASSMGFSAYYDAPYIYRVSWDDDFDFKGWSSKTRYMSNGKEERIYGKSAEDNDKSYTYKVDKLHNGRLVKAITYESYIYEDKDYKGNPVERRGTRTIQSTEYYDDENHRIKSTRKNGEYKEFYNNEGNTTKTERTKQHVLQYDENGNITFKITDAELGKIANVGYYESGRIRSIEGEDKRIEYYDSDRHSIKEETDKDGNGFAYDEDGNKTALFFKEKEIPLKDGKPEQKLVTVNGNQYLLDDNGKVAICRVNGSYYLGDAETGTLIYKYGSNKINLGHGQTDEWNKQNVLKKEFELTEKGLSWGVYGNNSYCHKFIDDHQSTKHRGLIYPNGEAMLETTSCYDPGCYVIYRREFKNNGNIIDYTQGDIYAISNPDKGLKWKNNYLSGTLYYPSTDLLITDFDGTMIKGHFTKELGGCDYTCNLETGHIAYLKYDNEVKDMVFIEKNLNASYFRKYDIDKNLLEEEANGKYTKYEKGPDGKMRIASEFHEVSDICIKYCYIDNCLKEIEYIKNHGCDKLQKDVFNDKEQKVCTFTYEGKHPEEKVAKATFFDGETQKITSVKETINGKDVETKYTYFPDSDKIETETILVDGKLSEQKLSDGTVRKYKNEVLEKETLPDGTVTEFYPNEQKSEQRFSDGSSAGWYADGSKKFEQQANGSRQEWHLNGKLSAEIICSSDGKRKISEARYDETGKRTHFEHYNKDGKDDTRIYLAKQKVAQKNVDKGAEKGKVQKKLNPISKAWKLHKALKEVDAGK